jgi:hypothetical protein
MGHEDGADQVKIEDDGIMALGGGRWVKSRRKAKASSLVEVKHASTSGVGGLVFKTIGGVWWFRP